MKKEVITEKIELHTIKVYQILTRTKKTKRLIVHDFICYLDYKSMLDNLLADKEQYEEYIARNIAEV